jgi:hypothetical protein
VECWSIGKEQRGCGVVRAESVAGGLLVTDGTPVPLFQSLELMGEFFPSLGKNRPPRSDTAMGQLLSWLPDFQIETVTDSDGSIHRLKSV